MVEGGLEGGLVVEADEVVFGRGVGGGGRRDGGQRGRRGDVEEFCGR